MPDHVSSIIFDPETDTQNIRRLPQRTDDASAIEARISLWKSDTASSIDRATTRPDASPELTFQEDIPSSLSSGRLAGQIAADFKKIKDFSPSLECTTRGAAYPSDSVDRPFKGRTRHQREPITVTKSANASVSSRIVHRNIGNCDEAMLAQPDIAPHRS